MHSKNVYPTNIILIKQIKKGAVQTNSSSNKTFNYDIQISVSMEVASLFGRIEFRRNYHHHNPFGNELLMAIY